MEWIFFKILHHILLIYPYFLIENLFILKQTYCPAWENSSNNLIRFQSWLFCIIHIFYNKNATTQTEISLKCFPPTYISAKWCI